MHNTECRTIININVTVHCVLLWLLCFIMTCTVYSILDQYRSISNEIGTCKYYLAEKTNQHGGK